MKRYGSMLVAAAVVAGSAMADYRPGYERPIFRSDLVGMQRTFPLPTELTMTRMDGARLNVTGFTLTEDTGIRCIQAPCPSFRTSQFAVVGFPVILPGNSIQYTAVSNMLVTGPFGRPRIVQRTLVLVDHSNSFLDIFRPYLWDVTVRQGFIVVGRAGGNPEPVYTTASVGPSGDAADDEASADNEDALLAE